MYFVYNPKKKEKTLSQPLKICILNVSFLYFIVKYSLKLKKLFL